MRYIRQDMSKKPHYIGYQTSDTLAALVQRLDESRRAAKMPILQLCERVGISRSTYNRLLKNDPSIGIGTVLEIMNILGVLEQMDSIAAPASNELMMRQLAELLPVRVHKSKEQF